MKQIQKYQKRNLFVQLMAVLFFPAIAAGMLSCSSSDDLTGNASSQDAPHQIILKATAAPESRMVYTEDDANKKLNVTWSTDPATKPDTLIVYYKSNDTWSHTQFIQTTDQTTDSHYAYFAGTVTGTPTEYVAVVKRAKFSPNTEDTRFMMPYHNIDGDLATAANNDILVAKATVAAGSTEAPTLQFVHKTSILKLDITLPSSETGTEAKGITLSATSGLYNQYYYSMSEGENFDSGNVEISDVTFSNGKFTLYIPVMGNNTTLTGAKLYFHVGYNYYSTDLGTKAIAQGKFYTAQRTISAPYLTVGSSPAGGDGTESNPYQIANVSQMLWMMKFLNDGSAGGFSHYYKLTNDINLENVAWTPVELLGSLDGNGKTITGLKVDASANYDKAGLFSIINGINGVKNLTVTGASVSGVNSGIIAGWALKGCIVNCKVSGNVVGTNNAGCIVGSLLSGCSIIGCSSSGNVEAQSNGGAGGITGYAEGTITGCYSSATVKGKDNVGGIVGFPSGTKATITSCYSTGSVTSSGSWGGIMGWGNASINGCYTTSNIAVGYNQGSGVIIVVTDVNTAAIVSGLNATIKRWNSGTYDGSNVAGTIHECKYKFVLGTGTGATPTIEAGAPQ